MSVTSTMESLEAHLTAAIGSLTAGANQQADDATLLAAAQQVQTLASDLAARYRSAALASDNAALNTWLAHREAPPIRNTGDLARLTFEGADAAAVDRCWRDQVRSLTKALAGLEARDKTAAGLWQYWQDGQDGREAGLPFFRAEAIRNTAADLVKQLELLQSPPPTVDLKRGELLFSDTFVALAPNWKAYGDPTLSVANGKLTVAGEACALWLEQDFENAVVSFDYTPLKLAKNGGALFAFPGNPLPDCDWSDAAGKMEGYNRKIETYHCSLCRGGSGMTNLRRTGTGLRMLSTVQPDPCATLGQTYHVEILSSRGSLYVLVDGRLTHAYADAGVHGPILKRGRFGLRLFAGGTMELQLSHVQVHQVQP